LLFPKKDLVAAATAVAGAFAAAALFVVEQAFQTAAHVEAVMAAAFLLAAAGVPAAAFILAAGAARGSASDLLLDAVGNHPAGRVRLLDRHATGDVADAFKRDLVGDHDRAGLGHTLGHAAEGRHRDGDLLGNVTVAGHVLDGRHAGAVTDHVRAGDALFDLAGNPNPFGARPGSFAIGFASALAAIIALVVLEELVEALRHGRAAGHFPALVVTLVHAAVRVGRFRGAGPNLLHHRAIFAVGDALADGAALVVSLADRLVDRHLARARLGGTLGATTGVLLLDALLFVDRARRLIVFGNPFGHRHGAGGRGAAAAVAGRSGAATVGASERDGRGEDDAAQQNRVNAKPTHDCFS
jgi:hypothetical protein